jgi:integrase
MPYSPATKRHIKSMLFRLFELAMKRDWLEAQRNPMSLVRVKGRNRVVERVVLTPEQMLIVRQNLDDPYLLMSELTCYPGPRICEVLGLMWGDFDPGEKTLSIRRSAVDGHVADVKSEASRDVTPLSGDFISFLLRWQRIAPHSDEGWMFPSIVTGRPYHAGILLRRHLKPLAAKVGVPTRVAHFPPHLSQLAGCCRNGGRGSAEDDASRRRRYDHECLRQGVDGQQARSPHKTA